MRGLFESLGVALVTPFANKEIDYDSLKHIVNLHIKMGTNAIIILATTGEGSTITSKERINIIKFCKNILFYSRNLAKKKAVCFFYK